MPSSAVQQVFSLWFGELPWRLSEKGMSEKGMSKKGMSKKELSETSLSEKSEISLKIDS